jgi:hypothetical protein
MNAKLFDLRQVLIFVGDTSMHDGEKVKEILLELGFSESVEIYGEKAMLTPNLYSGYFDGEPNGGILMVLKEKIYDRCKSENIGALNFFLIDATDAPMFKSIWHDGFY